jgi:hypothetical protein
LYGTAEFGTFSGSTWNRNGYLYTTNGTIIVVNGVMSTGVGSIIDPVWRDGYAISLTVPNISIGNVSAQGWQISDTGSGGWENFTPPPTANMSYNGKYLRYYATSTSSGETFYSNTARIRVLSATEQVVTIAMWDSGSDGWDDEAALRINVNGTDLESNARLSNGDFDLYTCSVDTGDLVQIYWVNGYTYDTECAFAVYYSDDPPAPMFDPSTGTTGGKVLVSKRYNNPAGAVGDNTLMGSFTVK